MLPTLAHSEGQGCRTLDLQLRGTARRGGNKVTTGEATSRSPNWGRFTEHHRI